jgi:protoporphyrinogen/coproporphyrinogen III oxidase
MVGVRASLAGAGTGSNGLHGDASRVVVIGGGIAGLSSANRLSQSIPGASIVLLERDARLGGKVMTERRDGFVIEGGPEALHASKPEALDLCQELGLGEHLVGINPAAKLTYVLREGQLCPLPDGLTGLIPSKLGPIARSRLVSPRGKLRMALEPLVRPRRDDGDEAVAAFFERRLGREAYRWLVDPLVGAIYASDGRRLSLNGTFPQLHRLEREHGGLIRGALAMRRAAPVPAGSRQIPPTVVPRGGLGELIDAIGRELRGAGVQAVTGAAVTSLSRSRGGYLVTCADGRSWPADAVVCAAPAPAAGDLLRALDPELARELLAIPHASVATVALGYPLSAVPRPLAASGYVTPLCEKRSVAACTWVSVKWSERAPADAALFRLSLGGAGRESLLERDDDELIGVAREELRTVLGITAPPLLARLFRWPAAMPQYDVGHQDRMAAIDAWLDERHRGLALAGNAYRGIGLSDCVRSADRACERVAAFLSRRQRSGA